MTIVKIKRKTALRKHVDDFERVYRGQKIAGENSDNWITVFSYWLLARLDEETRKEFDSRYTDTKKFSDYPTVKAFLVR